MRPSFLSRRRVLGPPSDSVTKPPASIRRIASLNAVRRPVTKGAYRGDSRRRPLNSALEDGRSAAIKKSRSHWVIVPALRPSGGHGDDE